MYDEFAVGVAVEVVVIFVCITKLQSTAISKAPPQSGRPQEVSPAPSNISFEDEDIDARILHRSQLILPPCVMMHVQAAMDVVGPWIQA